MKRLSYEDQPTGELHLARRIERPDGFELLHQDQLNLSLERDQAVVLRLGADSREIYLLDAAETLPYLQADYLAIQPESFLEDPRRGWRPFSGEHPPMMFGRSESPDFDLVPSASREHLGAWGTSPHLTLVDTSRHGTWWRQVDADDAVGMIREALGRS